MKDNAGSDEGVAITMVYHGVEGRISVLKRVYGLDRCLYHGQDGFERWVGWGIIAHDLFKIASTLVAR